MSIPILAVVALALFLFGLISGRLERSPITPPMVFVGVGLLVSPFGLDLVTIDPENPFFHLLAELTLVLVLFTDASRIDLKRLREQHRIPLRMLGLGLPLTIVLGGAAAYFIFPDLGFWPALVLAAILAPTDAALGQAVVSNERVPVRIRQALNVESGLNDGIALPAVVILLSCMAHGGNDLFLFTAKQVLLGPLVGVAVGYGGGRLLETMQEKGWVTHVFQDLSAVSLSLGAFAGAELIGGNGFLSAFIAGMTLGNCARSVCDCLYEFGEAEGQLMTLLVFMVFGIALAPGALHHLEPNIVIYALLSLTLIRIVPVLVSLIGMSLRFDTRLFLGWFGPRGIASILFALLLLEETGASETSELLLCVISVTVLFSVLLHGMTAYPGAIRYAERLEAAEKAEAAEHMAVDELPVRLRHAQDVNRS